LVGDAVSLVFERIVDSPNGKPWLQAKGRKWRLLIGRED
jgi:hypothetical protein